MTNDEKQDLLRAMFQGANLEHAQVNAVVESGATVAYHYHEGDRGRRPSEVPDTDVEAATQSALEYVGRLKDMARPERGEERFMALFARIFELPQVRQGIAVVGKQQGTTFHRNLVANCVHLALRCDIFQLSVNPTRMAERLEHNKDHSVKAALGSMPQDRETKAVVKAVIEESKKTL